MKQNNDVSSFPIERLWSDLIKDMAWIWLEAVPGLQQTDNAG